MGGHQSARMISDTWLTPPHIIEALGPFDYDFCAAPEPRPWPTAKNHVSLPDNGLVLDWPKDSFTFTNPPYSTEARKWLRKAAAHGNGIALVFARTETKWFVETVWDKATSVLFLHGRIHFHRLDGSRAESNSGAPSCLIAYGGYAALRLATCGLDGTFVRLREAA